MLAEILTIGDELCRGEIIDTNASFVAAELWERGITTAWLTSCRDNPNDLELALRLAIDRSDLVLVSGGLGPTEDDITVDAIARIAGREVVTDTTALERMQARLARARFSMTPNNLRQVRVPAGATVYQNPQGLAPGFEVPVGKAVVIAMPGVPRELKAIWDAAVGRRLEGLGEAIAKRVIRVFGLGESHIDHRLAGLSGHGASLHYQVVFPETLVKVVVRGADPSLARARLNTLVNEVCTRLGEAAYGEDKDSLAAVLGRALKARGKSLAVAESCTGGLLGALITDVPGSSAHFFGGWTTYADVAKQRLLGVRAETLKDHGAVSAACVEEMARGARELAGTSFGLAISGIAGPGGGTAEKPVGTVFIAVADSDGKTTVKSYCFPGARDQVRLLAAYWGMALILSEVAHD